MKVAIVGAGFAGLAAAWDLNKQGHQVEVFEAEDQAGGLAGGFELAPGSWSLEKHYHHIFSSDHDILDWLEEMSLRDLAFFQSTQTACLYRGQISSLDSPLSLLKFPYLSVFSKLRTSGTLAYLKILRSWQFLEKKTAYDFLVKTMGQQAWSVLWEPLFVGKFSSLARKINAAWFWARIFTRTKKLGYFTGGFANLAKQITNELKQRGVKFSFGTSVSKVEIDELAAQKVMLLIGKRQFKYDQILLTTPLSVVRKIFPQLPQSKSKPLKMIGAQTLVLQLNKPFFSKPIYWLNINEKGWPFLAVVEHTNLINQSHYDGKSIVYVGKYLPVTDKDFLLNKDQLLKQYQPYLDKLSPRFVKALEKVWLFKEANAQPVTLVNHSAQLPTTQLSSRIFWVSMQHVYPWDRGVNFAVKFGRHVVKQMLANEYV